MLGEVIGQTSGGMAVIRAPSADFVLNAQVQLPVGSKIVFEPTPLSFGELAAKLSPEGLAAKALSFDPLASRWWPSLSDALDILAQHAPAAARAVAASLPSPGPQMVPGTLFFLAALRAGIVESWLGAQTMQVLRDHGGRPLAERISADFGNIARQSGDALPGEWRAVSLPLMHDAQLSQIQLITRRHADEDDKQGGGHKTTRFIVNLSLSRLGDMQLDGLMREPRLPAPGQAKNLDIVIRSGAAFDESLRQELKSAYARGLQETAMTGSLQFQPDRQGWVTVAPAASDREQLA
jgi:hypothetical protein